MLRTVCLAVAIVLAAPPARAEEFSRSFDSAGDLAGLKIIRGDWAVRPPRDATIYNDVYGAYTIRPIKHRYAAFTVPSVNTRTLTGRGVWRVAPNVDSSREVGVIIGDPEGFGTRPGYYASVTFGFFTVGQVTIGFLNGQHSLPLCTEFVDPERQVTLEFSLTEDALTFSAGGATCSVPVSSRPVGMVSVFGKHDYDAAAFGPKAGLLSLTIRGDGPPVAKNHADPRLRRHIRELIR